MKAKLKFHKTVVTIIDESTNDKYEVVFSGNHTQMLTVIFKNGNEVDRYVRGTMHGNKSTALISIQQYLEANS